MSGLCGTLIGSLWQSWSCQSYALQSSTLVEHTYIFKSTRDSRICIRISQERELRSTRTHHTLQCQVYHNLLRCHRASNNIHQAIEAAKLGLAVCTSQQATKQKNIASWRTYFYFRLAECTLESSGPSAALAVLDNIDASAISPIEQALLALSRAVAHFHAAAFDAADHQLTACATAIEAALVEDELRQQHNGKDSDEIMIQSMRAQYFLLYAIVAQAVGRTGQLQQGRCAYTLA